MNAIMHRDYRQLHGPIVAMAIGEPPITLKVRSPGGFPAGVLPDRLLTTPSKPRNPALAHALHVLGVAEREGIGIDTMYLQMLRDGHVEPSIIEEDMGDVLCVLSGGRVDLEVRTFFDEIAAADRNLGDNVRAYIAITRLLQTTPLRPEALATAAQCTRPEALDVLEQLCRAGTTERLLDGSQSFRLTKRARERLRNRVAYTPRSSLDDHWELIRAYLDVHTEIGRDEVAGLLAVRPVQASRLLSSLYNQRHLLAPVGNPRGRGVRYRLARQG